MKKKLAQISLESFDQAPTGNMLRPMAQPETPEQPLVTSGYTEAPFSGQENYAAEQASEADARALWQQLFAAYDVSSVGEIHETFALNPGARDSQIHQAAGFFHAKLPALLVELLKVYNGQETWWHQESATGEENIYPNICVMFGTEDMIHFSKEMMRCRKDMEDGWYGPIDTDPRIQKVQWSPHWVPLASNEDHKRATTYLLDFDPGPGGKAGQVVKIEQLGNKRIVLGDSFDTWFPGLIKRHSSYMSLESRTKPAYGRHSAMESSAMVMDEDELDQLAMQANSLTSLLDDHGGMALEDKKDGNTTTAKMHLRFKKLRDGFVDTFRSTAGMIAKYSKRLDELESELLQGHTHGQILVNMSGLWQHFSDEKGPVTHNLTGRVKEDVEFSKYILTVFSQEAYDQLKALAGALHTGQGTDDEQAKRTALDVEKLKGPAEYMQQKWLCAAGDQPYLSVTGIFARQGHHPRPVAIEGVSLERLALLAAPYTIREYGSFTHGVKKLFVNSSKKDVHLADGDLAKMITLGREYIEAAKHYLGIYNAVWPIFRKIDESLDLIYDDFGLTDYSMTIEGEAEDGSQDTTIEWQTSDTGNVKRRLAIFDQLMAVVRSFVDVVLEPGVHEMARALRAAKFHGYLVEAGIKAAEGNSQHAGNVATESTKEDGSARASSPTFRGA